MHIHDDHMYHGAALTQVAEHPLFTAINSLKVDGSVISVAYKINDEIALYLKYASKPTGKDKEYAFSFRSEHLGELKKIQAANAKTFIALICIEAREICCLSYNQLCYLVALRFAAKKSAEDQYVVLVTAPKNKELRAYVNLPGQKNKS